MTNSEFIFWLNGYLSLSEQELLTKKQLTIVQNHLKLVFEVEGYLVKENQLLASNIADLLTYSSKNNQHKIVDILPSRWNRL